MEMNVEMNHYFQEIKKGIKNHEVHFDEFFISFFFHLEKKNSSLFLMPNGHIMYTRSLSYEILIFTSIVMIKGQTELYHYHSSILAKN